MVTIKYTAASKRFLLELPNLFFWVEFGVCPFEHFEEKRWAEIAHFERNIVFLN